LHLDARCDHGTLANCLDLDLLHVMLLHLLDDDLTLDVRNDLALHDDLTLHKRLGVHLLLDKLLRRGIERLRLDELLHLAMARVELLELRRATVGVVAAQHERHA
jgi:hypothetical protein